MKLNKLLFFILLGLIIISAIVFLPKKTITCYRTETITERVPYSATEYYYEKEPYTICAGTSFWTGNCNSWKTEYRDVQKSRQVTKYTDELRTTQVPYAKSVNWIAGACK